ncbi:MAG: hypothetical protein IT310_11425 [Anaerolineales bacterium]|nr:hypothetical protein [Anaerolineales bacterium]
MYRSRFSLFGIATLVALVFSALSVAPALADDAPPPIVETAPVEPPPEEVATPTPAPEEPALIPALPEGTELVVADEQGEALPLATQEAAGTLAVIDPVWCPVGVAPKNGASGCTTSYASLQGLVNDLMTGLAGVVPNKNGIIWIQQGADSSVGAIVLDGSDPDLGAMETFALTLQGGWDGVFGSSKVTGVSTISQSLLIDNWAGDVTLKDIIFSGITVGTTPHNAALEISTTKNISLTNVDVAGNTGGGTVNGAYLSNDDGLVAGDVVITNSTFTSNKNDGLIVYSDGAITITNLVANSNGGSGALLDNIAATSAKAVTLSGKSNQVKFNGLDGLGVYSKGAVTINSITANNNIGGNGVYVDNSNGTAAVKFTGTNIFHQNGFTGLAVFSDGSVSINNAAGNDNGAYGLYVDNHTSTTPQAVTLSVSGGNPDTSFNNNINGNVYIFSNGAITIAGLDTSGSNNVTAGVYLQNDYAGAVGGVTLNGWGAGVFGNAGGDGLLVYSKGAITISALYASGNGGVGAVLDNTLGIAPIKITGPVNVNNNGDGLLVLSDGAVTLNNVSAEDNLNSGVVIDNSTAATPQSVTLTGTSRFNRNGSDGLNVLSLGAITLNNVEANDNAGYGARLDNCLPIAPLFTTCAVVKAAAVTINGNNTFRGNDYGGLWVDSKGNITVNNVNADENGHNGAALHNFFPGSVGTVSVKNTPSAYPSFSNNGWDGLFVLSNGAITVMDFDAYYNGQENFDNADAGDPIDDSSGYGVYLSSDTGNVSVGTNRKGWSNGLQNNFLSGLMIFTDGTVTLNNIVASNNGGYFNLTGFDPLIHDGYGAYVDNSTAATPKAVTLLGTNNQFNGNAEEGLIVFTKGAIKVNDLSASDNDGTGIILDNSSAPGAVGGVTVSAYLGADNNLQSGLIITSLGAITINVIDAWGSGNSLDGWVLDNSFVGAKGGITLTSPNPDWAFDFWGNTGPGLIATSLGAIKISGLDAGGNGGAGAILSNAYTGSVGTVTLTAPKVGENGFNGNVGSGLIISSNGAITAGNLSANNNGSGGAILDNSFSGKTSPQNVTITGYGDFHNNGDNGLTVLTYGMISGSSLHASYNGQNANPATGWGVYLDNCGFSLGVCDTTVAPKSVTLTGSASNYNYFDNNYQEGLWVTSMGAITIKQVSANGNSWNGLYLSNQWTNAVGGITLTSASASAWNYLNGNGGAGLDAWSNGAITLSNLMANGNYTSGAYVDTLSTVTISGRNQFSGNSDGGNDGGNNGLTVSAIGNITISNLTANGNDGRGADLYSVLGKIALTGANTFNQNYADGLYADALGAVSMTNVTADANGGRGVYGYSDTSAITLTCGSMTDNGSFGWEFEALTTITLKGVILSGNLGSVVGGTLIQSRVCP